MNYYAMIISIKNSFKASVIPFGGLKQFLPRLA